ncbi:hypothetical protein CEXT_699881 [Caerostris extrusa]|uniref:Uncharacterized protein n=1 Tax=Caerostris extrusa TaxID=172846 RepID=A0AAV4W3B6_CAEEX|nr:hypothetical protein CEXT_699881 [Caerostris extrusa]
MYWKPPFFSPMLPNYGFFVTILKNPSTGSGDNAIGGSLEIPLSTLVPETGNSFEKARLKMHKILNGIKDTRWKKKIKGNCEGGLGWHGGVGKDWVPLRTPERAVAN